MGSSGRPKKVRYVQKMPKAVHFSPRGNPGRPDEVVLDIDEYEALKLADYQGFDQAQGAEIMRISRPSFGRMLRQARKKVADSLVNAKSLKIRLGKAQIGVRKKDFCRETFQKELEDFSKRQRNVARDMRCIRGVNREGMVDGV